MNTFWVTLSAGVGTVASLGVSGTLLAVALTVVRKNRPEGVAAIASSAAISLVSAIITPLAYAVMPLLGSREGVDYAVVMGAVGLGLTLVHTMAGVLLIVGIVKMASEPERVH